MPNKPLKSSIVISYREDGYGEGAFFDHKRVQDITDRRTSILRSEDTPIEHLENVIENGPLTLKYGKPLPSSYKLIPEEVEEVSDSGLLLIPGQSRGSQKLPSFSSRTLTDNQVMKESLLQGRPILAICGGSWELWSHLGGQVKEVKDHAYSRMMSLNKKGAVIYNVQIHRVDIATHTVLAGAIPLDTPGNFLQPTVNSVHWQAPDENTIPAQVLITAVSSQDEEITLRNRHGNQMKPELAIEAFETEFGAPVVGVQWHPEAYNNTDLNSEFHHNILKNMAQAGDAFLAKRNMLVEFSEIVADCINEKKQAGKKKFGFFDTPATKISSKEEINEINEKLSDLSLI